MIKGSVRLSLLIPLFVGSQLVIGNIQRHDLLSMAVIRYEHLALAAGLLIPSIRMIQPLKFIDVVHSRAGNLGFIPRKKMVGPGIEPGTLEVSQMHLLFHSPLHSW